MTTMIYIFVRGEGKLFNSLIIVLFPDHKWIHKTHCNEVEESKCEDWLLTVCIRFSRCERASMYYPKTHFLLVIIPRLLSRPNRAPSKDYHYYLYYSNMCYGTLLSTLFFFIRTSKFCLRLAVLNFFSFLKLKCS